LCYLEKHFATSTNHNLSTQSTKKIVLLNALFFVGKKEYRIVRGIKPNIFEIYVNGELINQEAASKDYQEILEKQVLKLNYKSFTQIVILGSASLLLSCNSLRLTAEPSLKIC
jgi:DNA repair exonuclease SbcCD ATPase subunit